MPSLSIPRFRPSLSFAEAAAFVRGLLPWGDDPIAAFERGFSDGDLDGRPVVLAPSARIALLWLLEALELEPGDEVVTQAFNFPAVPAAIRAAGATPRFVDVAGGSFEADWTLLEQALGPRARVVIVTHLYGNPVDVRPLVELCTSRGVTLVEDCAQGIGASSDRRPVGTFGHGAIFSLGPTKNLTLLGGGAVAVEDGELARRLAARASAHRRKGLPGACALAAKGGFLWAATHPLLFTLLVLPLLRLLESRGVDLVHRVMEERGFELTGVERSLRPSRPMAAVGCAQLRWLAARNRARVRNGWYLRSLLVERGEIGELEVPPMREGSVFMSFPVLHPRRQALARALRARGVDTDFGFMADCSNLDPGAASGAGLPHAARAAREVLHLPVHPLLGKRHLDRIAEAVRAVAGAV